MKRKIDKILIIAEYFYPDSIGGTGRYVYDLARYLAKNNKQVTVTVPRHDVGLPAREKIKGVEIERYGGHIYFFAKKFIPQTFLNMLWSYFYTKKILKNNAFDFVSFHHVSTTYLNKKIINKKNIPWSYHFHASMRQEWVFKNNNSNNFSRVLFGKILGAMENSIFKKSAVIIVLSAFSKNILVVDFGVAADKIKVIPGAVDEKWLNKVDCEKTIAYWPKNSWRLLSVRRLEKRMGLSVLIEAVKILRNKKQNVYLVIAGEGSLKKELQNLIDKNNLQNNIELLGRVSDEDLPCLYQTAELFILPTVALEGFGLATVESLASGTPVVGTNIGATAEIIQSFGKDFLVSANNAKILAVAIEKYFKKSAKEKKELSVRSVDLAKRYYSWPEIIKDIIKVYENIAD
ncbi:hypothetical protein COT95_00635 [Candidatus Falkowbacteria bacterium CG10_big_fil_rev_8_21_14_0_10_37_6]|uniref:Glycosyltransferase family 1 protein n=1 Tax=Candidatus Falkowbacteria bacterium CG10_big_fil_rev_8_21_14_0_10_37_6 TaxID=1974563 RepID=A0A2H0V7N7_9BACT|nr:MAG: hypothetical protein COT95_00635 [Candidatus Falkowbacteria bacterium CG10_big_fil_rev_8_21_14_0_10_37_6]